MEKFEVTIRSQFSTFRSEPDWRDGVKKIDFKASIVQLMPFVPTKDILLGTEGFYLDYVQWLGKMSFEAYATLFPEFSAFLTGLSSKEVNQEIQNKLNSHSFEKWMERFNKTGFSWFFEDSGEQDMDLSALKQNFERRKEREDALERTKSPKVIEIGKKESFLGFLINW